MLVHEGETRTPEADRALALSLAGVAGAIEVSALHGRHELGFSQGYGFDAIAIALLGKAHPGGTVLAALLFSAMRSGATRMQYLTQVPIDVISVIQALILLFVAADTLVRRLNDRGYPAAQVFSGFDVEREARTAAVTLEAAPGDSAGVGEIEVTGVRRVDTALVRDLLATRTGRPFSRRDLLSSQVSLYNSELFRFASVDIDSAWRPGPAPVPIRVQVVEGRFHQMRAFGGYGTDDCLRTGVGYTERNLLGEGRILDLNLRFSKLGVGDPTRLDRLATTRRQYLLGIQVAVDELVAGVDPVAVLHADVSRMRNGVLLLLGLLALDDQNVRLGIDHGQTVE